MLCTWEFTALLLLSLSQGWVALNHEAISECCLPTQPALGTPKPSEPGLPHLLHLLFLQSSQPPGFTSLPLAVREEQSAEKLLFNLAQVLGCDHLYRNSPGWRCCFGTQPLLFHEILLPSQLQSVGIKTSVFNRCHKPFPGCHSFPTFSSGLLLPDPCKSAASAAASDCAHPVPTDDVSCQTGNSELSNSCNLQI